jgi:hypothetical protein
LNFSANREKLVVNDTEERTAAIDGMVDVARVTARYKTVEEDYIRGRIRTNTDFESAIVELYRTISLFYIKAAYYFSRSTLSRTLRNLPVLDDWKVTLAGVENAEKECQNFTVLLGLSNILENTEKVLEELGRIESRDRMDRIKKWLKPDVKLDNRKGKLKARYLDSGRWLRLVAISEMGYREQRTTLDSRRRWYRQKLLGYDNNPTAPATTECSLLLLYRCSGAPVGGLQPYHNYSPRPYSAIGFVAER